MPLGIISHITEVYVAKTQSVRFAHYWRDQIKWGEMGQLRGAHGREKFTL